MLVYQQPLGSALLPESRIAQIPVGGSPVFSSLVQMNRHSSPSNQPAPGNPQVLAGREFDGIRAIQEFLFYALVILAPTVISEGCDVIEHQPIILGIKLCRCICIAG